METPLADCFNPAVFPMISLDGRASFPSMGAATLFWPPLILLPTARHDEIPRQAAKPFGHVRDAEGPALVALRAGFSV